MLKGKDMKESKKTIREEITVDFKSGVNINGFLEIIQNTKSDMISKGFDENRIELDVYTDFIEFTGTRLETDEEYSDRINEMEEEKSERRKLYEKLRKEFE